MIWPVAVALTVTTPLTATTDRLGAAGFADRDAAERTLFRAGQRAVAPLTAATKSPNPEVRRRAVALLDKIEAERLGTPTPVTLHLDRATPAEAVAAVARQSGYHLHLTGPAAGPPVTLHRDRVPFWAAVDAVADAAGLTLNVQDDGRLALFASDASDPFVSYAGPFRIAATGINAGQHRQLAGLPRKGLPLPGPEPVHLSFTLSAEPKAAVVGVGQPTIHVADDDRGGSLKPAPDADRSSYYPPAVGHKSLVHGFAASLSRRDRAGTTLKTLRGTVPVAVLAGTAPETMLDRPTVGGTAKGKAVELTVKGMTEADGLLTVEVAVSRSDAADGWQAGLPQRLEVSGADGAAWPFAGVAGQTGGPQSATVAVQYKLPSAGARPARLTLVEWRTAVRDVAFEFRDIPLP